MSDVEKKLSGTGVGHPNWSFGSAHGGDPHNFGFNGASSTSSTELEVQPGSWRADHGAVHEAYAKSNNVVYPDRPVASTSAKFPELGSIPADHVPACSPIAFSMDGQSPQPNSPGTIARDETAIGRHTDDETAARSVGSVNQVADPRFDKTMAVEELEATLIPERDSMSSTSNLDQITDCLPSSLPKDTTATMPDHPITAESHDRGDQGIDIEAPTASTLDQQRLQPWTSAADPRSDDGGASLPLCDQPPQMTRPSAETAKLQTSSEFEKIPHSSPIPNSSQSEPEMRPSTPPSSNEAPVLASPVQLDDAEANLHSTPPSSPMKLSSPPPLKPLKKAARLRTGLGAPFKSPFRRPIPCALPSSSLPPSSPPPLPESSPQAPPEKKRRAETPPEDGPAPSKALRTGPSPFPLAPFVSPLRNSQNGSQSRTRPPAGGFSTPLRPSRIQQHTFSSPAIPTEPDVFTTPATATSAYRLPGPPSSDPVLDADSSYTPNIAYKLRPPRTRTAAARPFKPPSQSTRPTSATVQALKQRLQSLRNALRIRGISDPTRPATESTPSTKMMDDDELEALALQWRNAGKEAAQDLWALVKDTAGEDSWGSTSKDQKDSWGWDAKPQQGYRAKPTELEPSPDDAEVDSTFTPPDPNKVYQAMLKKLKQPYVPRKTILPPREDAYVYTEAGEGEMECSDSEEAGGSRAHTLGTVLTSLGIPHEVLGWQEEEGEFMA